MAILYIIIITCFTLIVYVLAHELKLRSDHIGNRPLNYCKHLGLGEEDEFWIARALAVSKQLKSLRLENQFCLEGEISISNSTKQYVLRVSSVLTDQHVGGITLVELKIGGDEEDFIFFPSETFPLFAEPEEALVVQNWEERWGTKGVLWYWLQNRISLLPRIATLMASSSSTYYTVYSLKHEGAAVRMSLEFENGLNLKDLPLSFSGSKTFRIKLQHQTSPCKEAVDNFLNTWTTPWKSIGNATFMNRRENNPPCHALRFDPHNYHEFKPIGW